MYTLLQFSLLVFTICTKILFCRIYMLLWDRCLVLLTCGIIVCKRLPKGVAMWGAVAV